MHYFYDNVLIKKRPVLEVEHELKAITKRLSALTVTALPASDDSDKKNAEKYADLTLPTKKKARFKSRIYHHLGEKVNLFKDTKYFLSY